MRRTLHQVLVALAVLAVAPQVRAQLPAQVSPSTVAVERSVPSLAPAGARPRPTGARTHAASWDPAAEVTTVALAGRPSRVPYVLGGAVVGAMIAGIGFWLDDSEEAMFEGLVIAVVVPASALVGAGVGWLVYEIRH